MLQTSEIIAFAATTDLDKARDFYEHTLGLRLVEQNEFACVFDANGTMLRITAVSDVANPGYTVLGWKVRDIEAVVQALRHNGVKFTQYEGMDQDLNGVDYAQRRQGCLVQRSRWQQRLAHALRLSIKQSPNIASHKTRNSADCAAAARNLIVGTARYLRLAA